MATDNGNDRNSDESSSGRTERPKASDRWRAQGRDTFAEEESRGDDEKQAGDEDSRCDGSGSTDGSDEHFSRDDWEALGADPDGAEDFGYRITEWNSFETPDNSEQVMFLPADESLLKDNAFLVAKESVLCELGERC
jgi:hypothetical protein